MEPVKLGPFLGMNNRLPRNKLAVKDGAFLADAVNVDIGGQGEVTTRSGFTELVAMPDTHSLWKDLFVSGTTLYQLGGSIDTPTTTALLTGLTQGVQMSYTDYDSRVACTNGTDVWIIDGDTVASAGLYAPGSSPSLSASAGGSLAAGMYQVCVCYVSATGEKSGTSTPVAVDVAVDNKLTISGIPQKAACSTDVYMTTCNGSQFYRVSNTTSTSVVVSIHNDQSMVPTTYMLERVPPGHIIRSHNGRLFVAANNILYYTEPWSMLYNPSRNYIPFSHPITLVEPCGQNGVYVAAGRTYWLAGDVGGEVRLEPVLPYDAVLGTSGRMPNSQNVYWMSERGVVVGTPAGEAKNMQEDTVAVSIAAAGAAVVREEDGLRQIVTSLFDSRTTVMAAQTYMDAEIIHQNPV